MDTPVDTWSRASSCRPHRDRRGHAGDPVLRELGRVVRPRLRDVHRHRPVGDGEHGYRVSVVRAYDDPSKLLIGLTLEDLQDSGWAEMMSDGEMGVHDMQSHRPRVDARMSVGLALRTRMLTKRQPAWISSTRRSSGHCKAEDLLKSGTPRLPSRVMKRLLVGALAAAISMLVFAAPVFAHGDHDARPIARDLEAGPNSHLAVAGLPGCRRGDDAPPDRDVRCGAAARRRPTSPSR